jgi:hypothetical protein
MPARNNIGAAQVRAARIIESLQRPRMTKSGAPSGGRIRSDPFRHHGIEWPAHFSRHVFQNSGFSPPYDYNEVDGHRTRTDQRDAGDGGIDGETPWHPGEYVASATSSCAGPEADSP